MKIHRDLDFPFFAENIMVVTDSLDCGLAGAGKALVGQL
jgi:hypothetical protein